jgi:LPS-assembly protein
MAAANWAISRSAEEERDFAAMPFHHGALRACTKGKIARLLAPGAPLLLRLVPRCWTAFALACALALTRASAQDMPIATGASPPVQDESAIDKPVPGAPAGADLGISAQDQPVVTSSQPMTANYATKEMVWHGDAAHPVELRLGSPTTQEGPMLFVADEIHYYWATGTLAAIGHVAWTRGSARLLATSLVYNRREQTMHAENVRVGRHPFYVTGLSAEGPVNRIVIHKAEVTYNEPGSFRPTVRAETVIYSPGHYLRLGSSRVGVGGVAMIPIMSFGKTLNAGAALDYIKFSGGYRSSLGAVGTAALRIPFNDTFKVGGDLSIYTARGVMAGPAAQYASPNNSGDLFGYFDSGFISDYGSRTVDILGNPIPHARAYAEWRHQEQVTDDLTIDGDFNWWRDSEVLRDFRPKEFYTVQEPDNFVESVFSGDNYQVDAFTRFQPNSFNPVQERLPELSFNLLPTAIADGIYGRSEASAVQLIQRPPGGGQELADNRLDVFYGFSRPFSESDWLSFTPVAGGRVTNYSDTEGAATPGGYTRVLGEVGFDALLHTSGTFDYENPRWDIDGLRHLLEPHLAYRYIPEADAGQKYIPGIDQDTFTPDLEPLELGDVRNIDDLHPINTLRLGLDNTLQTRDDGYGSRDLVTFNVAEDLLFRSQSGNPDTSEIHTDFGLQPAKWLTVSSSTIFRPRSFAVREVENGITIHDADVWSVSFSNDFLRKEDDDYDVDLRVRLNEVYSVHLNSLYDERQHLFPEQSFAVEQNLVNTWSVRYVITLSQGPNRDGHFGANVQFDLIKF